MDQTSQAVKVKRLAKKIMLSAKNSLIVHLRFLDAAISRLPVEEYEGHFSVDGKTIRYDPLYVLQGYTQNKNNITRAYLHMILHCTFTHFYVGPHIVQDLWDIACDVAVENILEELSQSEEYLAVEPVEGRAQAMEALRQEVGSLTAEKIYRYLLDHQMESEHLEKLYNLFLVDDHALWYEKKEPELPEVPPSPPQDPSGQQNDDRSDSAPGEGEGEAQGQQADDQAQAGDGESENRQTRQDGQGQQQPEQRQKGEEGANPAPDRETQQMLDDWKDVSKHMELDLETFSKELGSSVGDLLLNIKAVTREKYDYTAFLRKFASMGERMVVDEDEFDYVYYTYGLRLYNNMPLVEPLEYKESHVVKEFVIAIDTSFSVHGAEVQSFVRKTYNLLKAAESFASKINLHIIQCDTKVQHDEKITTQAELNRYMRDMLLYGFGGTDFRPVFEYVDQLIAEKEFTNLKGLIYFTDGYGTFPQQPPAYKTAFAFVSDDVMFDPKVPPWAIKLILDPNDLKDEEDR